MPTHLPREQRDILRQVITDEINAFNLVEDSGQAINYRASLNYLLAFGVLSEDARYWKLDEFKKKCVEKAYTSARETDAVKERVDLVMNKLDFTGLLMLWQNQYHEQAHQAHVSAYFWKGEGMGEGSGYSYSPSWAMRLMLKQAVYYKTKQDLAEATNRLFNEANKVIDPSVKLERLVLVVASIFHDYFQ